MRWQEFMVGVQCGLLMFPINILIITIFRSIRPRIVSKSKNDGFTENVRPPAITMPTILRETEEVISLVSMSERNKMPELLKLESADDLCPALDRLHIFIQHMQGIIIFCSLSENYKEKKCNLFVKLLKHKVVFMLTGQATTF
nr:uncharacterized protein pkd1l3 [Nothobranchius furzeri]